MSVEESTQKKAVRSCEADGLTDGHAAISAKHTERQSVKQVEPSDFRNRSQRADGPESQFVRVRALCQSEAIARNSAKQKQAQTQAKAEACNHTKPSTSALVLPKRVHRSLFLLNRCAAGNPS